jgi:hypothetical protein
MQAVIKLLKRFHQSGNSAGLRRWRWIYNSGSFWLVVILFPHSINLIIFTSFFLPFSCFSFKPILLIHDSRKVLHSRQFVQFMPSSIYIHRLFNLNPSLLNHLFIEPLTFPPFRCSHRVNHAHSFPRSHIQYIVICSFSRSIHLP